MFTMFHKTLFRSLNVFNIVKGRFLPKEEQTLYLFNLCTSFEIYALTENKKAPLKSKLFQQLFSKAFYICIGPNIDGTDTFFVIRDTDVIHFQYSEAENMCISINCFGLPKVCITPDYAYYDDGQLFISCLHGGLCIFAIEKSQSQLIYDFKPCTSVLQSFPVYKDCFFRIETGPSLVVYRMKPFELESKISYDEQNNGRIFYSFPFGQDAIIYCTLKNLKWVSTNSDAEILFPPEIRFDPIVYHTPIAPSDVLVLTQKGAILRLQSDLSLLLVRKPDEHNMILKIFNLDGNHILLVNKCHDHLILNINNRNQASCLSSAIGLSNISIYNPKYFASESSMNFAPQAFSYVDNELLIFRQGIPLTLINEFELPERPTGMFSLKIENKECIAISFENGSKLLEIVKDGKNIDLIKSSLPFYEDGKTIGITPFKTAPNNQTKIYQIMPKEVTNIPFDKIRSNSKYPENTSFVAYTERMNFRVTEKNQLYFFGSFRNIINKNIEKATFNYDLNFIVTCLTITPPDADDIADYIVLGTENLDHNEFGVVFHLISADESEREEVINDKYPCRVCSIEFIEKTPEKPLGILIGLENGSLVVGELDFEKREIVKKQILQLGTTPCRIQVFKKKPKSLTFGLSTRLWLLSITDGKNLVTAHPFSSSSPSFMTVDSSYLIYMISGKSFGIYKLVSRSQINPDYSVFRQKLPSPIISIKMIDQQKMSSKYFRKHLTPFLFIICQREVFLMDTTSMEFTSIIKYEQDLITCANYSNRASMCKSSTTTVDFTVNSYLVISTYRSMVSQNREHQINCIYVYKVEFGFVRYLLTHGTSDARKSQNTPNSLLTPKIAAQVPYRITAISITNCPYSLYQKFSNQEPYIIVGCNNTILVYSVTNQKLSLLARIDHIGTRISSIYSSFENNKISIYASDVQQSITVLFFDPSNNKIYPFSEEGAMRPISTDLTPFMIDRMVWCGGDKLGNFFIFLVNINNASIIPSAISEDTNKKTNSNSIKQRDQTLRPRRRLWFFYNINIGDIITSVDRGCDFGSSSNQVPFPVWYTTIGGNIGCFLESSALKKANTLMFNLGIEISKLIFSLTNCDSITFRSKYFQSFHFCDMDIVDIFANLTPQRKEYILQELKKRNMVESGTKVVNTIEELEAEINTCTSFFWLWNQELSS